MRDVLLVHYNALKSLKYKTKESLKSKYILIYSNAIYMYLEHLARVLHIPLRLYHRFSSTYKCPYKKNDIY